MKALSICQQMCPEKLTFEEYLGQHLGEGSDGEVFSLTNDPDKVIKVCVFFPIENIAQKLYSQTIAPLLDLLISNPVDIFARVYVHEYLGTFFDRYSNDFILYFYTMEKLEDISDDEKKVFHTIVSHEDRGVIKKFSTKKVREILRGLSHGLNFDEKKIIFFYEALKRSTINHSDVHPRNIMKDKNGNFKMIDFDRAQLKLNGE